MPYTPCRIARRDAGLCLDCGAERTGDGYTKLLCSPCSERNRAAKRAYRQRKKENPEAYTPEGKAARKPMPTSQVGLFAKRRLQREALGLCAYCGLPKAGADQVTHYKKCAACRAKSRAAILRQRTRQRETSYYGAGRNGKPLPVGKALPKIGIIKLLRVGFDMGALKAIRLLKQRDREQQKKEAPNEPVEILFRTSRILRDAICFWENVKICPVRKPGYRKMIDEYFTLCLDARTLAVIQRHAQDREGNLAATVCDLLVATAEHNPIKGMVTRRQPYRMPWEPLHWDTE